MSKDGMSFSFIHKQYGINEAGWLKVLWAKYQQKGNEVMKD